MATDDCPDSIPIQAHIGSFIQRPFWSTKRTNMASPASFFSNLSFTGLVEFYVKTIQKCLNAGNQPKISFNLTAAGSWQDVPTVSLNHAKNQRKVVYVAMACEARMTTFISDYTNHTDIFYHRSMEEDKLFVLDVWSAYSQKDIKRLERFGPARLSGVG